MRWVVAVFALALVGSTSVGGEPASVPDPSLAMASLGDEGGGVLDVHCEECVNLGGEHGFTGIDCEEVTIDPEHGGCFDCHVFNSCHEDPDPGACHEYHDSCAGEDDAEVFALIDAAVDQRDALSIRAESEKAGKVRWNRERQAIQTFNCRGVIVAHIPVDDELARRITA